MDPMAPFTMIFNAVATLTGGLISDVTSAVLAMVTFGFILLGLDSLKSVLYQRSLSVSSDSELSESDAYDEYERFNSSAKKLSDLADEQGKISGNRKRADRIRKRAEFHQVMAQKKKQKFMNS